jgi:hypothetical protein
MISDVIVISAGDIDLTTLMIWRPAWDLENRKEAGEKRAAGGLFQAS